MMLIIGMKTSFDDRCATPTGSIYRCKSDGLPTYDPYRVEKIGVCFWVTDVRLLRVGRYFVHRIST